MQVGSPAKHGACDTRGQCSLVMLVVVQNHKPEKNLHHWQKLFLKKTRVLKNCGSLWHCVLRETISFEALQDIQILAVQNTF